MIAQLRVLLMLGVVTSSACSESALGPRAIDTMLARDIVSGDGQTGRAGQELPLPLVVKVRNANGGPRAGHVVQFVITSGSGSVFAGAHRSNSKGIVQDYWTLGAAGVNTIEARAIDPTTGEKRTFAAFRATAQ